MTSPDAFLRAARPGASDAAANRSINAVLNFIRGDFGPFDGAPVRATWLHAGHVDAEHHLRLHVHDFDATGEVHLAFDFNTDVFDETRRREAIEHFLAVLDRLAFVNLHFSLLPRWRGAAPVERAILAGDETTGVCLMDLAEELDTGAVYRRTETPIGPDETLDELRGRLVDIGTRQLIEALAEGLGEPEPQSGDPVYAHKITAAEREIDWGTARHRHPPPGPRRGRLHDLAGQTVQGPPHSSRDRRRRADRRLDRRGCARAARGATRGQAPDGRGCLGQRSALERRPTVRIVSEAPDDPRRLAIAAIVRIDEDGAFANVLLPKMLAETDLDRRDKGFATELVYGSTRMRRKLDHVVDRYLLEPPPPSARAALRIGAHQLLHLDTPPHAAVSATVAAAPKRFRGLVNAILRKVATAAAEGVSFPSPGTELSYPDWIVDRTTADLGDDRALAALATMNEPATVHTRDDGYVQDPSSQLVAAAVPGAEGDLVLDLCAAPGGKATALAGRGMRVVAGDQRLARAGLVATNRTRLGLDDLHVIQADATTPPFAAETFDAVLVDAPCSGLGALRRRPDARWRIQPGDVDELARLQGRILAAAAPLVKPGGTLVYSVCTLTRAESAGVVAELAERLGQLGFIAIEAPPGEWEPFGTDTSVLVPGPDADGMALARWTRG